MIYFELVFGEDVSSTSTFICVCVCVDVQFFQHYLKKKKKKDYLSPLKCPCFFDKDQFIVFVWVYIWAPYSLPLIYFSIPLPIPHYLYYFKVSFRSSTVKPKVQLFYLMLAIWIFCVFHINFRISQYSQYNLVGF